MGGVVFQPLGYDLRDGALSANEIEAAQVRSIFERYLELGSVERLRVELSDSGVRSKRWTTAAGRSGLVTGLRDAHRELLQCGASPLSDTQSFQVARAPELPHQRQLSRLAFLTPDLQRQILDGAQPGDLTLRTLLKLELPLAWADQRAWFEQIRAVNAGGR